MSDFQQIALTSCLTVVTAFVTYVLGALCARFWLEPVYELRKLIGEIAASLVLHANVGPGIRRELSTRLSDDLDTDDKEELKVQLRTARDELDKVHRILREQASQLMRRRHAVRGRWLFGVPTEANILKAMHGLIGWSNSLYSVEMYRLDAPDRLREIAEALGITIFRADRIG